MTDAGVKNIKDLSSLMVLNLSQNCNLTDKTLELVSGTPSKFINSPTFSVCRSVTHSVFMRLLLHSICCCLNVCMYVLKSLLQCLCTGLTGLISLNISNSRITSAGLRHLKTLKNLKQLTLEACRVSASDIKKLQSTDLPNLASFRPE